MPKVSKESATQGGDYGVVVDRADEVEGYSINFTTFREDIDATPLMKGLPDDRCQCPHWGYVIAGRVTFRSRTGRRASRPAMHSLRHPATSRSSTSPAARS